MPVVGIDHVQLAIPPESEEAARAFYAGVLGLREVVKPEVLRSRGGAWFESGNLRLHLGVEHSFVPAKKAHPAFLVTNLSELVARCEGAGYSCQVAEDLPGYRRVYVHDPFGNRIEITEITESTSINSVGPDGGNSLSLVAEEPISGESRGWLIEAMVKHQTRLYGPTDYTTVGLFLKDSSGTIRGGLSGRFRWKWFYIEMLWVAEHLRRLGHGSTLLQAAENFAALRGGVAVQLDTGGDEALPFYLSHGYEVVGEMDGYPPGETFYFLRKWLKPAAE